MMKLFAVYRTDKVGYDQYDAFVCVAADEEAARMMPPHRGIIWLEKHKMFIEDYQLGAEDCYEASSWPVRPAELLVEELAETREETPRVVLVSFNAG